MTKERFIEINIEEGLTWTEVQELWMDKPEHINMNDIPEELVRKAARWFLPRYIALRQIQEN